MSRRSGLRSLLRFGLFELDTETGELRKSGIPLHLPPQPTRVLMLLANRPGELVTREELRQQIWGSDTYVDFEQGLNHCVKQIRDALCDRGATARYIQTLPRRGYRFVARVVAAEDDGGPDRPPRLVESGPARPPEEPWRNHGRRLWLVGSVAAAAVLAVVIYAILYLRVARPDPDVRRFSVTPAQALSISTYNTDVVISPDGRRIAYHGGGPLWVLDLGQDHLRKIEATFNATEPFWSPDSQSLGYFEDHQVRLAPVHGGAAVTVCPAPGENWSGAWSPDGQTILFSTGSPPRLYEVSAKGGEPKLILPGAAGGRSADEPTGGIFTVRYLPGRRDARAVVFAAGTQSEPTLFVQDLRTGRRTRLGRGSLPWYSPSGHLVYQESGLIYNLWAIPFSVDRLAATGQAFRIVDHARDPSVASDGTLVYVEGDRPGRRLAWVDRQGRRLGALGGTQPHLGAIELSPDGRFLATSAGRDWNYRDVWVHDVLRDAPVRLTRAEEEFQNTFGPAWSADGSEVAFYAADYGILVRRADGSGPARPIHRAENRIIEMDWSRDGRHILFCVRAPGTHFNLWYLKREGDGDVWEAHPFAAGPADERYGRLSPDGRYVAYQSDESGRKEVLVRPFPQGDRKWVVSRGGGRMPRWRRDGKELYYIDAANMLVAVSLPPGEAFDAGREQPLFPLRFPDLLGATGYWYDVSADRQRFLIVEPESEPRPPRIRIVQNWHSEFRGRR